LARAHHVQAFSKPYLETTSVNELAWGFYGSVLTAEQQHGQQGVMVL
jgi:hypothetical protein